MFGLTKRRKRRLFADFDRVPFAPATTFLALPISRSAGKLLKAATVVHAFVPLLFLLPQAIAANIFSLTLMWFAGVRIAQAWFFRDADVLERTRWKRFRIGDVVSSVFAVLWIMAVALFSEMPAPLKQRNIALFSRSPWTVGICIYAGIYLAGLLGGFYNVKQFDERDKKEILGCFQEWRLKQNSRTS